MPEIYGIQNGLNLDNLEETADEEINTFLTHSRIGSHESAYGERLVRGPLDPGPRYDMTANSLWLYTRPDFAKLHGRVLRAWGATGINSRIITGGSATNLHTYINQGWEIGIENCTRGLQVRGFTKAQLMELVMHAQMSAGIRGLEVVSRALGVILGDFVERDILPDWPEGWAPDMEPFYCGLDPSTMDLTPGDLRNIEEWYERTIGWQPPRIRFLAKHEPATLKAIRARWEAVFKGALPKQMMPYLSLRHNIVSGNPGGLKEAALLAKAWGVTDPIIVNTVVQGAYYFCGPERLDMAEEVLAEVL
ncbi:MAG: hypothetical protein J2P57_15620 [Acidimicrobiaceae bacterium]|nr:hypothetical protein [Acidimicrobiaceae bacterium]